MELGKDFEVLAKLVCWEPGSPCQDIWKDYLQKLPEILEKLNYDARAIAENDPAANSVEEVYLSYPGFLPSRCTGSAMNSINSDCRSYHD